MKDAVSNEQLYRAIMDVHKKIDEVVDTRIAPLEIWRANLMGKIAVIGAVGILGVNLAIDWIKTKFLKNI